MLHGAGYARAVGGERAAPGRPVPAGRRRSTRSTARRTPAAACRGSPRRCASSTTTARPWRWSPTRRRASASRAVRGEGAWRGDGAAARRRRGASTPGGGDRRHQRAADRRLRLGPVPGPRGVGARPVPRRRRRRSTRFVDMSPDAHGVWDYLAGDADLPPRPGPSSSTPLGRDLDRARPRRPAHAGRRRRRPSCSTPLACAGQATASSTLDLDGAGDRAARCPRASGGRRPAGRSAARRRAARVWCRTAPRSPGTATPG